MTKIKLSLAALVKFSLRGSSDSRLMADFLFYTIKNELVHQVFINSQTRDSLFSHNVIYEFTDNVTEPDFLSACANPGGSTLHACKVDDIILSSTIVTVTEG